MWKTGWPSKLHCFQSKSLYLEQPHFLYICISRIIVSVLSTSLRNSSIITTLKSMWQFIEHYINYTSSYKGSHS